MSKYYFFDGSFLSKKENAELIIATPQKEFTNATWVDPLQSDTRTDIPDWEYKMCILYPYVIYDEAGISVDGVSNAKYKLWYFSNAVPHYETGRKWLDYIIDKNNTKGVDLGNFKNTAKGTINDDQHPDFYFALCYMESNDGINWIRPNCGEFYYQKTDGSIVDTNIVFLGQHGTGVTKNTHPLAGAGEPAFLFACAYAGLGIAASADGIHWEQPVRVIGEHECKVQVRADSHNHIFWSPEAYRYVIITRGIDFDAQDVLRTVVVIAGPERLCPDGKNDGTALNFDKNSFSYPTVALRGPLHAQPYSMPVYRLSDGYYIGVVSIFNYDDKKRDRYKVYASLAWSREGINWNYIDGYTPFIANSETFSLDKGNDFGMIYCASPIEVDGKIKVYYGATPELHYFSFDQISRSIRSVLSKSIPQSIKKKLTTRTTTLNVATVNNDKLAGLFAKNGRLVTNALPFDKGDIYVSADVLSDGDIKLRLVDSDGNVIPGFNYDAFEPVAESVCSKKIVCKNDISQVGKELCLEISLNNSVIYSLEIK